MIRPRSFLPVLAALVFAVLCLTTANRGNAQPTEKPLKYALLVGVTKYQHSAMNKEPLDFPEIDAKALHDLLVSSGYTVDLLLGPQATQQAIRDKLNGFDRRGNADGAVVIGLFGHGTQPDGTNTAYYCPYDTTMRILKDAQGQPVPGKDQKEQLQEDPESLIAMKELLDALKVSPAGNRVLLADCCRNDPTRPRGRGSAFGSELKLTDLPDNTATLFACSKGQQAYEHKNWGHGAFTKCLLEEMTAMASSGRVTAGTLADRIGDKVPTLVRTQSNGRDKQTPNPLINGRVDLLLTVGAKVELTNSIGMKLVQIPAGEFLMGNTAAEVNRLVQEFSDFGFEKEFADREQPQHRVRISQPFFMGKFEVTKGEFAKFVVAENYQTEPESDGQGGWGYDAGKKEFENRKLTYTWRNTGWTPYDDSHPVVNVTWNDAKAFCAWLSRKEGQTYRLPRESEWEYACRAGTATRHPGGDDTASLARIANIADQSMKRIPGAEDFTVASFDDGHKFTAPVGSFAANGFGLHDMIGNAQEWCEDVYDEKAYGKRGALTVDPLVTSGSTYQVVRGGSWYSMPWYVHSALRLHNSPAGRNGTTGFRVVRE